MEGIMTEREKMLAGQLYDCGDPELLSQWHKAKDLVRDYNRTDSADTEEKERILNELLGGRGENLWITSPFYVDYGNNIYFGNNCEVNMNFFYSVLLSLIKSINRYFFTVIPPFDSRSEVFQLHRFRF